jgi:hypothetical protein
VPSGVTANHDSDKHICPTGSQDYRSSFPEHPLLAFGDVDDAVFVGLPESSDQTTKFRPFFVLQRSKINVKRSNRMSIETAGQQTFRLVSDSPLSPCQGEGRGFDSLRARHVRLTPLGGQVEGAAHGGARGLKYSKSMDSPT